MTPTPGTKAGSAYQQGKYAATNGLTIKDNPYILGRMIHLSNWWIKGYNEVKSI